MLSGDAKSSCPEQKVNHLVELVQGETIRVSSVKATTPMLPIENGVDTVYDHQMGYARVSSSQFPMEVTAKRYASSVPCGAFPFVPGVIPSSIRMNGSVEANDFSVVGHTTPIASPPLGHHAGISQVSIGIFGSSQSSSVIYHNSVSEFTTTHDAIDMFRSDSAGDGSREDCDELEATTAAMCPLATSDGSLASEAGTKKKTLRDGMYILGHEAPPLRLRDSALFSKCMKMGSNRFASPSETISSSHMPRSPPRFSDTFVSESSPPSDSVPHISPYANMPMPALLTGSADAPGDTKQARHLRQRTTMVCIAIVFLTTVLAMLGSFGISFVTKFYTTRDRSEARAAVNTAVVMSYAHLVQRSLAGLEKRTDSLAHFTEQVLADFQSARAMRDAIADDFLDTWSLWLADAILADSISILVPFCHEKYYGSSNCSTMVLSVLCPSQFHIESCVFFTNDDTGLLIQAYKLATNVSYKVRRKKFLGESPMSYDFNSVFLPTSTGYQLSSDPFTPLLGFHRTFLSRQSRRYTSGRPIMCSIGSYMDNWLTVLDGFLHRSERSLSMVFDANGSIYGYAYGEQMKGGYPCYYLTIRNESHHNDCGGGSASELDRMVDAYRKKIGNALAKGDLSGHASDAAVMHIGEFSVVFKNFLSFVSDANDTGTNLVMAYATPLKLSLGRRGALQRFASVVISMACVVLLGGFSLAVLGQLQGVLELVSLLATHAATYDTDAMERVLETSRFSWLSRVLLSPQPIIEEFLRIAQNLRAYRPFIPQSLLAPGENVEVEPGKHSTPPNTPPSCAARETEKDSHFRMLKNADVFSWGRMRSVELMATHAARLQGGGLRRVKGTIMAIRLAHFSPEASEAIDLINLFVSIALRYATTYNGVVDVMEASQVLISFNCHYTVPGHQERACKCAIQMLKAFEDARCRVAVGMASGYIYVGTIGTEEQKARTVAGESVVLARALLSLQRYLGSPILVTEPVAYKSATAAIPLDVVSVYCDYKSVWTSHVVYEIMSEVDVSVSPYMLVVRRVFHLIRKRDAGAASRVLRRYLKSCANEGQEVQWQVRRLRALVLNHASLIKSGYHRRECAWETLEGEEILCEGIRERLAQCHYSVPAMLAEGVRRSENSVHTLCETDGAGVSDAARVRRLMDEEAATRHRHIVSGESHDEEKALFPLFLAPGSDKESDDIQSVERRFVSGSLSVEEDAEGGVRPTEVASGGPNVMNSAGAAEYSPAEVAGTDEAGGILMCRTSYSHENGVVSMPRRIESLSEQVFYRTDKLLGRGTFSEVFLAVSESGRFVALKVFPVQLHNARQLAREVATLAKMHNEYIVAYDSCAVQGGYFFLMTEYLAAGSIGSLIERLGNIPEKAVRKYSRDILFGLEYLHQRNGIHCDLKPDNILLTSEGGCKLADFGAAVLERSISDSCEVRGTPWYMAPEAVMGEWSTAADVFSFGMTIAHMLLGHSPWEYYDGPNNLFFVRYAGEIRLARETHSVCAMQPELPCDLEDRELEVMVRHCCSYCPTDRPTVAELITLLS